MRKKELKLVITFRTTADAMEMERIFKERGVPGRMIPVPRTITAGCGLAWCTDIACRDLTGEIIKKTGTSAEAMHEVMV